MDQPDGGNAVVISTVREDHAAGVTVYNFEVEGDHTYFVEDGSGRKSPVWVHNECARQLRAALKAAGQAMVGAAAHVVPRGNFANRADDVVKAIERAKKALENAGIDINDAINGFMTASKNHMGTHTDVFFRKMGKLFKKHDAFKALAKLRDEVLDGKF